MHLWCKLHAYHSGIPPPHLALQDGSGSDALLQHPLAVLTAPDGKGGGPGLLGTLPKLLPPAERVRHGCLPVQGCLLHLCLELITKPKAELPLG